MASILVIDDDALVQKTLGAVLECAGHAVHFAEDGREGVQKMRILDPDLIITDIIMPNQEGIETIIAIRKSSTTVPIIAISGAGSGNLDVLKAAKEFGATKTIRKPFGAAALLEMVNACLAMPRPKVDQWGDRRR